MDFRQLLSGSHLENVFINHVDAVTVHSGRAAWFMYLGTLACVPRRSP
jgi:hypothetical protein